MAKRIKMQHIIINKTAPEPELFLLLVYISELPVLTPDDREITSYTL